MIARHAQFLGRDFVFAPLEVEVVEELETEEELVVGVAERQL